MARAKQEGGLVDTLKRERAEQLAALAIPASLAGWGSMSPEQLEAQFYGPETPEEFRDETYRWLSRTETNLEWFLSHRQRQGDDENAPEVKQENNMRERHEDHFLSQRVLERVDRPFDQLAAVVKRLDGDARRQAR